MNLILCGLPLSGKSTLGRQLAERRERSFLDTDRLIERAYADATGIQASCRQIFLREGEPAFREWETGQIASLLGTNASVIAVGGGSLLAEGNAALLRQIGVVVYLKVPWSLLWERGRGRMLPAYLDPIHPERAFYKMAAQRAPLCERAAHYTLEAGDGNERDTLENLEELWQAMHSEPSLGSPLGENRTERPSAPSSMDVLPASFWTRTKSTTPSR